MIDTKIGNRNDAVRLITEMLEKVDKKSGGIIADITEGLEALLDAIQMEVKGGIEKMQNQSLAEAIAHLEESIEKDKFPTCDCRNEHKQLLEWLKELQQLRTLKFYK